MSIRKNSLNYQKITGYVPSFHDQVAVGFKPTLERDFPVYIEYIDEAGGNRHYFPNVFVSQL